MKVNLSLYEARVIGCLMEKEVTTPEQYPLSLNALTNACNQKSNRDPVLELDEAIVQQTVDRLIKRYLVGRSSGFGNRVTKYQHRFCNTEFGELRLSKQEFGIICELLLRGPQTPGELRVRTERLCRFGDVEEVEIVLGHLMERDEPLVAKLPREAGKREARYAHLFGGGAQAVEVSAGGTISADLVSLDQDRLETLEKVVEELRQEVGELRRKYQELLG